MFGRSIRLFKLLGFTVRVDLSWLIIAVLVTWSLAAGWFPLAYADLSVPVYWFMGAAGAAGLFVSIVVHELCHSLVAKHYGLPMKGITLFVFGGVAEMTDEPPSPRAEFFMALAGPGASVAIAGFCYAAFFVGRLAGAPVPVLGVLQWLGLLNLILVAFNMVPGYPLDGGRVLRSALWRWKGDIRWATRVASKVGSGFGMLLIILGVVFFILGNMIGGLWWFLIGLFIRSAASGSYRQLLIRQAMQGVPVRRIMRSDPVTVSPGVSVRELVDDYMLKHHFKSLPVVEDGVLLGRVNIQRVKDLPQELWSDRTVSDLLEPASPDNTIAPDEEAMRAMAKMNRTGVSRLLVAEGNRLVGVLALRDLMSFLSMKLELEESAANLHSHIVPRA